MAKRDRLDRWIFFSILAISIGFAAASYLRDLGAKAHGLAVLEISSPAMREAIYLDGSTHRTIRIELSDGGFNVVEVSGHRARVLDANCPDRICVKRGWLSKPGDQAVCLPHRLVVRVRGGEADEVHGISQ